MEAVSVLNHIVNELNTQIGDLVTTAAAGNFTTFDEYKRLTGRIQGLQRAREVVSEVLAQIERGDNND